MGGNMLRGELVKTVTSDGIELQGFWSNKKSDTAVFHSHGTAGDFYTHSFIDIEGNNLDDKNISFLTANNRGHDVYADHHQYKKNNVEWTSIGGGFERFEDCLLDLTAWIDFLKRQGVKKIILQSHSLTQKILYYQSVAKNPYVVGQIHLSPCNDAGYVLNKVGKEKYQKINKTVENMIKQGNGKELLPKELYVVCPMSAIAYGGYITEDGPGNLFPYHNPTSPKWKTLQNTKEPLLVIYGGSDAFIQLSTKHKKIDEAAKLFQEHAKSAKNVTVKVIPGASHSYLGYEIKLTGIIGQWIDTLIK